MCLSSIESVAAARACNRAKLRKLKVTVPAPPKAHTTYACTKHDAFYIHFLRNYCYSRFKKIYRITRVYEIFFLSDMSIYITREK